MKCRQKEKSVESQVRKSNRKSRLVRVPFYYELQETSEMSGIGMSKLLSFAWEHYKGSKDYYNLIMKETM